MHTKVQQQVIHLIIIFSFFNWCVVECFVDYDGLLNKSTYLEAQVGSYKVFNCPLEYPHGIEIPYNLHWNKDNVRIFSWHDGALAASNAYQGRINLVSNSYGYGKASVNLTSIRESDAGWYECRVVFPNRTPSTRSNGTWFHLSVDSGSFIKIPPVNLTVMEGEPAFFHCVTKYPDVSYTIWHKDGINIADMNDLSTRATIVGDGSLAINPTIMTDLGEYECNVRTAEGDEQQARAFLNIQYKAKVVYAPKEVYLPYGRPAVLDCHFRSNPPLTNLRWEKDGFLFDPYNVQGVFYKRNGSLYFSSVDESHAGRYSCTPYNKLGSEGPSPLIQVIVQRPPIFTIKPKQIYVHKLGETVVMSCDAADEDGEHRAVVQWRRKDGLPLPDTRISYEETNFTIEKIVESDRGMYECVATNEAASVTADTELLIENVPPRPPYNLTANSTDTAITLRWQPGFVRPYLEYTVWYRRADSPEWRTMKMQHNSEMEVTVINLEPGREYEFMVLSQDRYGDGMFSKPYRYFTKVFDFTDMPAINEEPMQHFAQVGPPRNLTVTRTEAGDEFVVSWYPPEFGIDTLRCYVVRWHREPGHFLHGSAETRQNYHIVKYLAENEIYSFQVFSISTTDYQAGSNEFEILVPQYKRIRAVAFGAIVCVIFTITTAAIYIYVKKRCFEPYKDTDEKYPPS